VTPEELDALAALATDPEALIAALPEEEIAEYERCKQSVIDARRAGERIARETWID
jgi:hypothetical protein